MITFRVIKRRIKHCFQIITTGWCDVDTWSLDVRHGEWIIPRLKKFKEIKNGNPSDITEQEWDIILDKMIYSFEYTLSDDYYTKRDKKFEEGINLFAKYYSNLWW